MVSITCIFLVFALGCGHAFLKRFQSAPISLSFSRLQLRTDENLNAGLRFLHNKKSNLNEYDPDTMSKISALKDAILEEAFLFQSIKVMSFTEHKNRMEILINKLTGLGFSNQTSGWDDYLRGDLVYISSSEDELDKEEESTNVNDKFWKLGAKYGKVVLKKLVSTYQLDKKFRVDIRFSDQFILRYVYSRISPTKILFDEFQWIVLGFNIYTRVVNRSEEWIKIYRDDSMLILKVEGFDQYNEPYNRMLIFQTKDE